MNTIKNAYMPAQPFQEVTGMINGVPTGYKNHKGLTKREMFAMAAMQGLLVNMGRNEFNDVIGVSREAVNAADALLAALESTK